jgi:mRNA interferase RelE/StbE
MQEIRSLEKLTGFKEYFRIRIGDYRIGIKILDNEVYFLDVGHRKEIYKRFP